MMLGETCDYCREGAISLAPEASEYCEMCGSGFCISCVETGLLVKDEKDNVYYCEGCHRASLPQREPVIATITLAGYYDKATRCAVEGVIEPRTGSRVHQREVE